MAASSQPIVVDLVDKLLWKKFKDVGNEMIMPTNRGRTLIPKVMITISGLNPADHYDVCFSIVSEDTYKYRFSHNEWKKKCVFKEQQNKEKQVLMHRDSPNTGRFWMSETISFKNVLISHDGIASNIIQLQPGHKYHVEIVIVAHNQTHTTSQLSFPLEETTFITVSDTYRSPDLERLKQYTRMWEKGDVSKTTLFKHLQIPHSLPACNSLNDTSPTFSQLGSSILPPPPPLLDSSNLSPPSFFLPSQLNSSIPQPFFSLPQLVPPPSFQLPDHLNPIQLQLPVFLPCPLMEQSSVTSSLSDPATSLPESQDMQRYYRWK